MTTKTFRDFALDDRLVDALERQGITTPFPIQELTLPMALKGADIIGQARTGTGKTLGFGLPLLQRLDPDVDQTQALVVVPTRELCLQVTDDLTIGKERGLTIQSVYGGVGYDEQIDALTGNVHIVVGTPGRLLDHLNRGNLDLSHVRVLVLDEADEMLDMGFLPDVERLIDACSDEGRHTMLFSATMPTAVVKLARRYMTKPTFMRADVEDHETAPNVEQHFLLVHRMDKPRVLARILQSPGRGSAYVFTRTKRMADRLVSELADLGVEAIAVHGDLRQGTREKNMGTFRDGRINVLVATEVAARGLDVEDATHVINYDCPDDEKMYLHRIGRTARAGNAGVAVTFAEFNEVDRLNVIRKAVQTEKEILEVFSTSDELTAAFDLPDETPWDHLAKSSSGRSRSSSSGSKGSTSDRSSGSRGRSDRRKGSTDGRSKNESGGRNRSRRARSGDQDRGGSNAGSGPATEATEAAEEARESFRRERTRGDSATSGHPPKPGDRDEKAETVRTRTRSTERSGRAPGDDEGSGSGRTRARARARDDRGGDRGRSADRSGTGKSSERSRDAKSGNGSRDDRKGRERSSSRGDRSGHSSSRQGTPARDHGGSGGDTATSEAPRDESPRRSDASPRGDGRPALARRVKVEHLP